ncbi:MAG: hypothetical protein V1875_09375 [Candidatus Altiarchaeota archaeon]
MSEPETSYASNSYRARRRPINQGQSKRKLMLDMGRQKYFRFDLEDLLTRFNLGDNKSTVLATVLNKMSSHSMDDAFEYVGRITESGTLTGEKSNALKALLQRYSRWR